MQAMKTRFKISVKSLACLILSLSLFLAANLFAGGRVLAAAADSQAKNAACQGIGLVSGNGCSESGTSAEGIVQLVVNILSTVVGIIAVIMIIIGGLRFVMSSGDSNATNSARNTVIYALVGIAIVFLAQVLVRFVLFRVIHQH